MKMYFIILVVIASSCKAQNNLLKTGKLDTIRYYSEQCHLYMDYERRYLSDSLYIESHGDVSDTFMLAKNGLNLLHKNIQHNLIDVTADFNNNNKRNHYYYYGLSATDTLKRQGESDVQYKLRLYQSIVVYMPVKIINENNKETFCYYILRECYPITQACLNAKIANGQYGVVYFEKGIGYTGHSAGNEKCLYKITNESYTTLVRRRNNK
jgi:hypothetical protein